MENRGQYIGYLVDLNLSTLLSAESGRYLLPVSNTGTAEIEAFAMWNGASSVNIFLANHAVAGETDFDEVGVEMTMSLTASGFSLGGAQILIIDSAHTSPAWTPLTTSSIAIAGYGVAFIRTAPSASPVLSITKTHAGGFAGPQAGSYTITVQNTGTAATTGTITGTCLRVWRPRV